MLVPSPSHATNLEALSGRTVVSQSTYRTTAGTTDYNESWDRTKCHPINKLPVEILSRVLSLSFSFGDLVRMPTAHATAHVCELWKAIVEETPDFWTKVTNISRVSDVQLKLRKSANASIEVVYCDCPPHITKLETRSFLKLVAPHIERWSSIYTEGAAPQFFETLRNLPDVQLPRLPRWTVKRQASSLTETASLQNLPSNIVDIRIEGLFPSWGSNTNNSLVSLELCGSLGQAYHMFFTTLAATLKACPNLKILRLGPLSPRQSGAQLSSITTMRDSFSVIPAPSLEHLELQGAHSALFSRLLKNLNMPKLSKFFLHSNNWGAASLNCDAGGRSLLQTALDNAGCSSLTVFVGRATTLEWIKIHGETGGSRTVEVELLKKAGGVSRNVGLNSVTIPIQLRVIGSPGGFLLPLLQRTPTASHLWYRPHLDSGWKSLALTPEDLNNLPSQWEHTLGPAPSPISAFIRDCYAWHSAEMRYGDPLRERRLMDIEYDFDTTKPGN